MKVSFDAETNTLHIPEVTGVTYLLNGNAVSAGPVTISEDTLVDAVPDVGFKFPEGAETSVLFEVAQPESPDED